MPDDMEVKAPQAGASRTRRALPAVILVLVAAVGVGLFVVLGGGGGDGSAASGKLGMLDSEHPEVGQRAPDFALIDARDGTTVRRLSDYRGKTVFLNWYATWCGPCKAEIPDFQRVSESFPGQVVVIGVNLRESRSDAVGMLDGLGATYGALLDSDGDVANHYRLIGMPSSLLIDAEGIVRASGPGRVTEEALRAQLAKLGIQ